MKGIRIVINDSFSRINSQKIELADGIALTAVKASRMRLQDVCNTEEEEEDIDLLIKAVEIEINILSYAAELYAELNKEETFNSLTDCIEDYEKLREELVSMKE